MAYQPKPGTLLYSNMLNDIETGKMRFHEELKNRVILGDKDKT